MRRALRRIVGWLVTAFALAILAAWFVFLRPESLGGPVDYVMIRGTSMLPTYQSGDLVIVRAHASYAPREVVAYRVPQGDIGEGKIVIHRIVKASNGRWILQGDNNKALDPWMPASSDIVGTPWIHVAGIGRTLATIHQPAVLGALAAALAVMAMLWRRPPQPRTYQRRASNLGCGAGTDGRTRV
jgi:signal peptidase